MEFLGVSDPGDWSALVAAVPAAVALVPAAAALVQKTLELGERRRERRRQEILRLVGELERRKDLFGNRCTDPVAHAARGWGRLGA